MQQVSEEMPPCRFCGSKCRVENFNSEHVEATLWICGNNEYFGGDCPDQTVYLYEHAWQAAMRSKDHSIAVDDVGLVKWHMPTMLRWLAENIDAPRLPDGTLTGRFLYAVAENIEHRTAIGSQSIEGERRNG